MINRNQLKYAFEELIKNQWLRHYTCSGFCKTTYHLLISPPPTNLPNTLKIHTGENKIDRQGRQYACYFPANGSTYPDVFQPKTFLIPRGIIPQNYSLLGFAILEKLGKKQIDRQTESLTDWHFYRVIQRSLCQNYTSYTRTTPFIVILHYDKLNRIILLPLHT